MAQFAERNLRDLLGDAIDPENDVIQVRRLNGVVVTTWPQVVTLNTGSARVEQDGTVIFDDLGNSGVHPSTGARTAAGSFTFTLWDGELESPTYPCDVNMVAPVDWSATSLRFDVTLTKLDFD